MKLLDRRRAPLNPHPGGFREIGRLAPLADPAAASCPMPPIKAEVLKIFRPIYPGF
jgi:hypothetical protein